MNLDCNRRDFLKKAALLPLCAAAGLELTPSASADQQPIKRVGDACLKVALNAYSFGSKFEYSFGRHRPGGASLFDVADFCAKLNFDGFDATGYYFPNY